jgi:hypothetical protein
VTKMTWKTEPDPHDYPAAAYLSLIATPDQVNDLIDHGFPLVAWRHRLKGGVGDGGVTTEV